MKPMISKRIIRRGKRAGMLMAFDFGEGKIGIGFCLCHKGDKYDHELATKICLARAKAYTEDGIALIPSIDKEYHQFVDRCERFFKVNFRGYHDSSY